MHAVRTDWISRAVQERTVRMPPDRLPFRPLVNVTSRIVSDPAVTDPDAGCIAATRSDVITILSSGFAHVSRRSQRRSIRTSPVRTTSPARTRAVNPRPLSSTVSMPMCIRISTFGRRQRDSVMGGVDLDDTSIAWGNQGGGYGIDRQASPTIFPANTGSGTASSGTTMPGEWRLQDESIPSVMRFTVLRITSLGIRSRARPRSGQPTCGLAGGPRLRLARLPLAPPRVTAGRCVSCDGVAPIDKASTPHGRLCRCAGGRDAGNTPALDAARRRATPAATRVHQDELVDTHALEPGSVEGAAGSEDAAQTRRAVAAAMCRSRNPARACTGN